MASQGGADKMPTVISEYTRTLRDRARRFEDDADPYLRGLIATRVYRDQPALPTVRKRAEILAQTLEAIEPIVLPEERIIGAAYRRFRVHRGVSDADAWRIQVLHPERHGFNDRWPLPDEVREKLSWWQDRGLNLRGRNALRSRNRWLSRYAIANPNGFVSGHTLPDHSILIRAGIGKLRRRIAERLETAATEGEGDELRAMDRCLEGLSRHCLRCAESARDKAQQVEDPLLRERLEQAAANCEVIAVNAPGSFAQALQLIYFSNFADHMDSPGDACSFGRIDQILAPFYDDDLRRGALTKGDAFDLVCHFLIKRWTCQDSNNITVGGVGLDGRDATNDLSFFFIEAMEATEMVTDITVRLHRRCPEDFVRTVARVVRRGFGRPSVYNDEVVIEALTRKGVDLEDARDYAPLGCVEVMIPGRSAFRTMCMGLNLPKVLELTLNGGRCLVTGDRVWDDVPEQFETFDALLGEYHTRVRHVVELGMDIVREDERIEPSLFPRPWLTVLSRGGIESAVDLTAGQPKYDPAGVTLDGVADIANSLCAVRRLVFEEKRLTLDELRAVLRDDWEGHEGLRQHVLNRLPRFGQDDPEINAIARQEAAHYAACFEGRKTFYGGDFWPMIFGVGTSFISHTSPSTGATPSGRKHGTTLAMSLQPSPAGPRGSPTELLRSVASVDFRQFPGGVSNVQECDPSLVSGDDGLDRLADLIRGFFELGGMELSLNFLSEEQLRAAQADPDRHRYLMVRLFGLSAQFVNLSPELQESIIERVAAAGRRAFPAEAHR